MRSVPVVPALLAVAAGLHLAALPSHLDEGVVIGAFFLVVAAIQLGSAVLVARSGAPPLRDAVVAFNAAVVVVWALSRTVGLPLAHGGVPEAVGLLDALAIAAGGAAIAGLYATPWDRQRRFATVPVLALVALLAAGAGLRLVPVAHAHADTPEPAPVASHEDGHAHER